MVVKQLQNIQRKMNRKRMITQIQPQKLNQLREKQIENNTSILQRMKKQFKGLQVKCDTLPPLQNIQSEIQRHKSLISNIKQKIASLKIKTKHIGYDIINTDQVLIELKQTQRQWQVWMKRKYDYETKLNKIQTETQNFLEKLSKINKQATQAENFFKGKQQSQKQTQLKKNLQQKYNQKKHAIQALKKNSDIFLGLKQQKYHQLLKQFENHVQKDQQIQIKTKDTQFKTVQMADEVRILQTKLKDIKKQSQQMKYLNNLITQVQIQNPLNSAHETILTQNKKIRSYSKFNTFRKPNKLNNSSRIQRNNIQTNRKSQTKQIEKFTQNSTTYNKTLNAQINQISPLRSNFGNTVSLTAQRKKYQIKQLKTIEHQKRTQINQHKKDLTEQTIIKLQLKNQKLSKIDKNSKLQSSKQQQQKNGIALQEFNLQKSKKIKSSSKIYNQQQQLKEKRALDYDQSKSNIRNLKQFNLIINQQRNASKQELKNIKQPVFLHNQIEKQQNNNEKNENNRQNESENSQDNGNENQNGQQQNFSIQKLTIDLQKIQKNLQDVSKKRIKTKENQSKKVIDFNDQFDLNL